MFNDFESAKKEAINFVKGNSKHPGLWGREYCILRDGDNQYHVVEQSKLFSFQQKQIVYRVRGEYKFGLDSNKCVVRSW